MDAASSTARELLNRLADRMGFDPNLESVGREELGHFIWDLYTFEYQGLAIDLALAEDDGQAYMVLLASKPDERDGLYEQVFLPAVEALASLE
jgi:hypothetical protein